MIGQKHPLSKKLDECKHCVADRDTYILCSYHKGYIDAYEWVVDMKKKSDEDISFAQETAASYSCCFSDAFDANLQTLQSDPRNH